MTDYINIDPFAGDESEVKCRTVKVRVARKDHQCYGLTGQMDHKIQRGDRYRYERALVDGKWGEFRMCLPCLDRFLAGDY